MTALSVWTLTTALLWLKMTGVAMLQGVVRLRSGRFRRPEDAEYFGRGRGVVDDPPLAVLGQAVLRNDLETVPLFLLLLLAFALSGASASGVAAYGGLFLSSRLVHTAAYLRPRQPLRNLAFGVGTLTTLTLSVHMAYASLFSARALD
ncbi:MAG: MAPEG family protein [Myxococcota bacterium]